MRGSLDEKLKMELKQLEIFFLGVGSTKKDATGDLML
jgi:hypothetical protein